MKKLLISLLALNCLTANAVDFTIDGRINAATCEVKTTFKNLVIILPTVGKSAFNNSTTAAFTPFKIEIDRCPHLTAADQGKELYAFFESEHLDLATHTLNNAATRNAANNVNIQLTNKDGSAIKVSNQSAMAEPTFRPLDSYRGGERIDLTKQGGYSLTYGVQYFAKGPVSPGIVESFATFNVRYK